MKVNIKELSNDPTAGMTMIVKTIGRLVLSFVFLFGWYIVFFGHLTPGGGFAGGVILAIAYVFMMLAFGGKVALAKMSDFGSSLLDNLGALAFITLGFIGLTGGYFFLNIIWHGHPGHLISAGIIPLCNLAIAFKVGASLYAIFIGLSIYGRIVTEEDDK
jgi:multicomponent Na+:H+ antiporter subunit B